MCAALLLAGCSSSGTVGSGKPGGKGFAGGTGKYPSITLPGVAGSTGDSGGTSGSSGGASGGNSGAASGGNGGDDGCTQALIAIQSAKGAQSAGSPQEAASTIEHSIAQLNDAAGHTQKPGAADAITKVSGDLQAILAQLSNGQQPDTSTALTDAQAVVTACGS